MKKLVLFGAGKVGKELLSYPLCGECSIIALVDNEKSKWGREVAGYTVSSPEMILSMDYDVVIIAVIKDWQDVWEQLIDMGVSTEKIMLGLGWHRARYMKDPLDDYFLIEKKTVPFRKGPVIGGGSLAVARHQRHMNAVSVRDSLKHIAKEKDWISVVLPILWPRHVLAGTW